MLHTYSSCRAIYTVLYAVYIDHAIHNVHVWPCRAICYMLYVPCRAICYMLYMLCRAVLYAVCCIYRVLYISCRAGPCAVYAFMISWAGYDIMGWSLTTCTQYGIAGHAPVRPVGGVPFVTPACAEFDQQHPSSAVFYISTNLRPLGHPAHSRSHL